MRILSMTCFRKFAEECCLVSKRITVGYSKEKWLKISKSYLQFLVIFSFSKSGSLWVELSRRLAAITRVVRESPLELKPKTHGA